MIVAVTVAFGFLMASQVESDARANVEESIHHEALILRQLFLQTLIDGRTVGRDEMLSLTQDFPKRVTLIGVSGVVLADNREEARRMDNHGDRPEVLAARNGPKGVSERFSQTLNQNMLYVAVPVVREEVLLGYVRVAVPLARVEAQVADLRFQILLGALLFGSFALLLGFWLAQRVTRPIAKMTAVASDIALGRYELRLPEGRRDEIGRLSSVLNELAGGTQARINELTNSRNQMEAVLAGMTEGLIAVDQAQRVLHLNRSATLMLQLNEDDPVNRPLDAIVDVPELLSAVQTCLSEQISVNSSFTIAARNFDLSVLSLQDEASGTPAGAIVVIRDETEKLLLDKVRADFVANASHELKTPISAIRGFVDTILDDREMPKEVVTGFLQRVQNQVGRLDNLVQDLLQLSRFDSHQNKGAFQTIDLNNLLERVYASKLEDADMAQVSFRRSLPGAPLFVSGEQEALHQMVVNLVDNAIKYSRGAGEVELHLAVLGSLAVIEVSDNGIGIPASEQERIFERFYRVDRARSREKGGTGLGLSIVKHIAQIHGGSVRVESEPDVGSRFIVMLPLAGQQVGVNLEAVAAATPEGMPRETA